jgi:hypothetical protein
MSKFSLLSQITESLDDSFDSVRYKLKSKYQDKEVGPVVWQVFGTNDFIGVGFDLTYRRMTPSQAWTHFASSITQANNVLNSINTEFKNKFRTEIHLAKKPSGGKYSEYEQEFVGEIKLYKKDSK